MKKVLVIIALCYVATTGWTQVASTCVQTLRQAQSTYENGRLHELPTILKSCLASGFTVEETKQAYKLLTMAYIYLEEPEQADESMMNLLQTDHFFEVNPDVDPAEFISLYNKYRTHSMFRYGIQVGPGLNLSTAVSDYFVGAGSDGGSRYTPKIGFSVGGVFEKDFLKDRLTLAGEINRTTRTFDESGPALGEDGVVANGNQTIKLTWWEFNPLAKYKLSKKSGTFETFVLAGPGFGLITKGSYSGSQLDRVNGSGTVTGPDIEASASFKPIVFSAITGVGARLRLGGIYINADVRAQLGLSIVVDAAHRTNAEAALDYAYTPNDFRLSSLVVNIGVLLPYFKPKKLIR